MSLHPFSSSSASSPTTTTTNTTHQNNVLCVCDVFYLCLHAYLLLATSGVYIF